MRNIQIPVQIIGVISMFHFLFVGYLQAQNVSVNNDGSPPDASAILDLSSSNQGFLAPRMTQTQRIAITNPATGLLIYQTDNLPGYRIYNGSSWAIPGDTHHWNLTGNSSTSASSNYLGTSDAVDLVFRTNATERIRIEAGGNMGIGTATPVNQLDVEGGMAIGSSYSGTSTAPSNGLIVEGQTGIGTTSFGPSSMFEVENSSFSWAMILDQNYSGSSANFGQYIDMANTGSAVKFGQYIDLDGTSGSTNNVYGSYAYLNGTSGSTFGYFVDVNTASSDVDYGFYAIGEEQNYFSGNLSLGSLTSVNKLDVEGGAAIGASYSGSSTAPSNGLIVQGSVGIGENNPQTTLDVADFAVIGNLSIGNESTSQGLSNNTGNGFLTTPWLYTNAIEAQGERGASSTLIAIGNDGNYSSADQIHLVTNGASELMIDSDGEIGVSITDPLRDFHINHKSGGTNDGLGLQNASGGSDIWHLYTWLGNDLGLFFNGTSKGSFDDADGSYSITSDRRLKKNIVTRNELLNDVMQMRVAEFHYKDQDESSPKEIGFIAQEVLSLFPHLINQSSSGGEEGTSYYAMDYAGVSAIAIGAIQEQQQIISNQENRINEMEQKLQQLQDQLQKLQNQIDK